MYGIFSKSWRVHCHSNPPQSLGSTLWRTLNTPPRTFFGGHILSGAAPLRFSVPARKLPLQFSVPARTRLPAHPTQKKSLPLHSWRPLAHKSHIECTSPSRSQIQYICSLPWSKQAIDWDFISKVKPSINPVINLEVKNNNELWYVRE